MLVKKLVLLLFLISLSNGLNAQKAKELFRSDSILDINLEFDRKAVINDTDERESRQAILSYQLEDGKPIQHKIGVKVRGNSRTFKQICSFPPLQLKLDKSDTKNTLFKGQKKLKLVTHCKNNSAYESNVQEEYLVYKLYQLVTVYSFKVRLCNITYTDIQNPNKSSTNYGFLIENIKDLAKRNNMKVLKDSLRNQEVVIKKELDKLIFFQYMIGNHDWSIALQHNTKLIIGEGASLPIAVPYDFDYCGLVNTPYAVPPKEMELENVKERYFRGFCRPTYQDTIDFYLGIEDEIFAEINKADYLTDNSKKSLIKYIIGFYKILKDPKMVDKKITRACKVKHQHAYEL